MFSSSSSFRSLATVSLFGLMSVLAGCGGQAGGTDVAAVDSALSANVATVASAAASSDANAPKPMGTHLQRRGHRGPESLAFAALRAPINLTADQRTKIETALKESRAAVKDSSAPTKEERVARASALASAIRSGNVAALESKSDAGKPEERAKRFEERAAAGAKMLATVHDTLTKDQRVALVAALSKHADQPRGDAERSERVRTAESKTATVDGREHGRRGMKGLLAGLDLTQAQKDALHQKFEAAKPTDAERTAMKAKREAARTERTARLQTFVNDSFDAKAFVTPTASQIAAKDLGRGQNGRAKRLAVLTSVLDAAQREKLAARIEQSPQK